MTSLETESEQCTKCSKPINGDRTICQCYRADIPKVDLDKILNNSYVECFTICPDCANALSPNYIPVLTKYQRQYMVDKMYDIRIRERELDSNAATPPPAPAGVGGLRSDEQEVQSNAATDLARAVAVEQLLMSSPRKDYDENDR
jgi:hypothetical protein